MVIWLQMRVLCRMCPCSCQDEANRMANGELRLEILFFCPIRRMGVNPNLCKEFKKSERRKFFTFLCIFLLQLWNLNVTRGNATNVKEALNSLRSKYNP
jgi:hypothetical protein